MDSIESRLKSKIESSLKNSGNTGYLVLINYKPITLNTQTGSVNFYENKSGGNARSVYVRFNRTAQPGELEFYTIKKQDKKSNVVVDIDIEYAILEYLSRTYLFDIKTGIDKSNVDIDIEFNQDLRIMNIKQNIFIKFFDLIYRQDIKETISLGTNVINSEVRNILYNSMERYAFSAYSDMLMRLTKQLRRVRGAISFYNIFPDHVYVPLFITGSCIFNPLLESSRNVNLFKNSDLYKSDKLHHERYRSIYVDYMTEVNICRCLHFNGYTKLDSKFILELLYGLINPSYPNKDSVYYESRIIENKFISKDDYIRLDSRDRVDYVERNLLLHHCSLYNLRFGIGKASDLYNIVSTIALA